jgi:hypothetical protein
MPTLEDVTVRRLTTRELDLQVQISATITSGALKCRFYANNLYYLQQFCGAI